MEIQEKRKRGRPKGSKKQAPVFVGTTIVSVALPIKHEQFEITIQANFTEYKGSGETILDALNEALGSDLIIKTKGGIVIKKGKVVMEQFFNTFQLRRFLNSSPVFRKLAAHRFEKLFNLHEKKYKGIEDTIA